MTIVQRYKLGICCAAGSGQDILSRQAKLMLILSVGTINEVLYWALYRKRLLAGTQVYILQDVPVFFPM